MTAGIAAASHGDLHVSVSNVTTSPERPNPGEPTTVTVTVRNAESSADVFEVTDVYIRRAGSARDLVRVEDLGTVPIGGSMEVPLTLSFDEVGVQDLRINVAGHHENGSRGLEYPLTVSVVEEEIPQIEIGEGQPVTGVESPINVSVSNGGSAALQSLELTLDGASANVRSSRRVASRLEAGEERSFEYWVRFTEVGPVPVDATLRYRTRNGDIRTVEERFTVQVDDEEGPRIGIESGQPIAGIETPVNVSVSNGASTDLRRLTVSLDGSSVRVNDPRRVASRLGTGDERTFTYSIRFTEAGTVPLETTLSYQTRDGEIRTIRERFSVSVDDPESSPRLARIELTGVDVQRTGDRFTIAGSASNVGLDEANSVVVRVLPSPGITPVPPNREYFVGTVPGSDFVSFDVTARIDANATAIPVEVTYLADGLRRTESASIPLDGLDTEVSGEQESSDGGGILVSLVGGLLSLAGLVAIANVVRRRWRGGRT